MSDEKCPGEGKCHGCLKWCGICGDVAHVCDTRLRDERCDEHPIPPTWNVIRSAEKAAQDMIERGRADVREGGKVLGEVVSARVARQVYDAQIERLTADAMGANHAAKRGWV